MPEQQLPIENLPVPQAPSETRMWQRPPRPTREKMTEDEIDAKYSSKEERIVTETNREKLPNFVEALKRPGYMILRPMYQRRRRWDNERQSRLIESFIMNIPVPPLFLYETRYNSYEVMDGQQRITAVKAFYESDLTLTGLERWPELNGLTYKKLPSKIKTGIDRRSISYVVLLTESAENDEDAMLLKQLVFERLNTGGVRLSQQEIRNALYQGKLNALLLELSKTPLFRSTWRLPLFSERENAEPNDDLLANTFYSRMQDMEVILRFFALRHYENYQKGMQGFLDLYMVRSERFTDSDISFLKDNFDKTLNVANRIYGDLLFIPYDRKKDGWDTRPQVAFSDAVMVALSGLLERQAQLVEKKDSIVTRTKELFLKHPDGTFTGRGNTKQDVKNRILLFREMLVDAIK